MNFITATHTDVGLKKKTNQDSLLVLQAQTGVGNVLLAVVCDGMGGLAKGEVASAAVIRSFAAWFHDTLPGMLADGFSPDALHISWEELVQQCNQHIANYGAGIHVDLGTTVVALFVIGETYYILNIGDSRIYVITNQIFQLTKDQTYIQREMDEGRMTLEQALCNPQRNVLLQCIGASRVIEPDFMAGQLAPDQCYLLCSDGFRHVISPEEILRALNPRVATSKEAMTKALRDLTELDKARKEDDNISAILIRTC